MTWAIMNPNPCQFNAIVTTENIAELQNEKNFYLESKRKYSYKAPSLARKGVAMMRHFIDAVTYLHSTPEA